MFVTYVLYSTTFNEIYIGYTSDLIDRFHSHNSLATKGYTVRYRPWEVIHVEFMLKALYGEMKDASRIEFILLKNGNKIHKISKSTLKIIKGTTFKEGIALISKELL